MGRETIDRDIHAAHEANPATTSDRIDRRLLGLAGVVLLGAVAALLDTTVISVALDHLGRAFGVPVSTVQLVSTAYLLAMALVIPVTGWCAERFGTRDTWLCVLSLFLAGSLLCASAWSAQSLIAFRVVQGLGAGMILPLTQIILAQAAGPRRFGRIMALVAVPGNLVPVVGPVLGGLVLHHLHWRWIFLINAPVCVLAIGLAWRGLPAGPARGRQPLDALNLDVLGLALLSPAVVAIVYGLSRAGQRSRFTAVDVVAPVLVGLVLLAVFVAHARRARTTPVLDVRLFRHRPFAASAVLMFLSGAALYGPLLLLPLYYQRARGLDPLTTGLALAPQGIGTALALAVVGPLTDRIGARPLVAIGALATAAGTLAYAQLPSHPDDAVLAMSLLLRGAGLGAVGVPAMAAAYHRLPRAAIPRATSATNVVQRLGASLGTAVVAVILQRQIEDRAAAGGSPDVLTHAFASTFWWTIGFAVLILPLALLLPAGAGPGRSTAGFRRAARRRPG
ncbi:MAG: DHA2 family efflux MFS transporter permease subunit [Micromonosporaceae bacterium]